MDLYPQFFITCFFEPPSLPAPALIPDSLPPYTTIFIDLCWTDTILTTIPILSRPTRTRLSARTFHLHSQGGGRCSSPLPPPLYFHPFGRPQVRIGAASGDGGGAPLHFFIPPPSSELPALAQTLKHSENALLAWLPPPIINLLLLLSFFAFNGKKQAKKDCFHFPHPFTHTLAGHHHHNPTKQLPVIHHQNYYFTKHHISSALRTFCPDRLWLDRSAPNSRQRQRISFKISNQIRPALLQSFTFINKIF